MIVDAEINRVETSILTNLSKDADLEKLNTIKALLSE